MSNITFQEILIDKKKALKRNEARETAFFRAEGTFEGFSEQDVDLDLILPFEGQARRIFRMEKLEELAASISDSGVISPVILLKRAGDSKYQVISGERRIKASRMAGKRTIPARVCNDDRQAEKIAFFENDLRENLHPIEKGHAMKRLLDRKVYGSIGELAKALNKNKSAIAEQIRYVRIKDEIAQVIIEKGLKNKKFLREISKLENVDEQRHSLQKEIKFLKIVESAGVWTSTQVGDPELKKIIRPDSLERKMATKRPPRKYYLSYFSADEGTFQFNKRALKKCTFSDLVKIRLGMMDMMRNIDDQIELLQNQ